MSGVLEEAEFYNIPDLIKLCKARLADKKANERSHEPKFYHREEYLSYRSSMREPERPKSPGSLRLLDCSSPPSAVAKSACSSLYHSSYRTTYSKRFQSDYMQRKSRIDPFLKDTNLRKAEIMWKLKNNS